MIVSETVTAQQAYRAHVMGDCWPCSTGRWCDERDELDYAAAREDSRRAGGKAGR